MTSKGYTPPNTRGLDTYPGVKASDQFKISLHPVLSDVFRDEGGADWLRQYLMRVWLGRLDDRLRTVAKYKFSRGTSFGDLMLMLEAIPDVVLLADGRCVSKETAQAKGWAIVEDEETADAMFSTALPESLYMTPGRPLNRGRPRSDRIEPPAPAPGRRFDQLPADQIMLQFSLAIDGKTKEQRDSLWKSMSDDEKRAVLSAQTSIAATNQSSDGDQA